MTYFFLSRGNKLSVNQVHPNFQVSRICKTFGSSLDEDGRSKLCNAILCTPSLFRLFRLGYIRVEQTTYFLLLACTQSHWDVYCLE